MIDALRPRRLRNPFWWSPVPALLALLGATPGSALSLDEAVTQALARNPRLRGPEARAHAATFLPKASAAFPNPTLEAEAAPVTFGDTYEFDVGVDQALPVWGRSSAARRVARAALAETQWTARDAGRSVAAGARERYRRAALLKERVTTLTEVLDRENRLLTISRARQTRGEISEISVLQIEARCLLRRSALETAGGELRVAIRDLAFWIGLEDTTGLRVETVAVIDDPDYGALEPALEERADLMAMEAHAEAEAARVDLVRAERFEDPSAGIFLRLSRDADHASTSSFLGGRITLPLPLLDRRSGSVDLARAEAETARLTADAARRVAAEDLSIAVNRLAEARRRLHLFENAGPARAAARLAEEAYAEGRLDAAEWNDAEVMSVETELLRLEALEEWHRAVGVVEEMVGRTLAPSIP